MRQPYHFSGSAVGLMVGLVLSGGIVGMGLVVGAPTHPTTVVRLAVVARTPMPDLVDDTISTLKQAPAPMPEADVPLVQDVRPQAPMAPLACGAAQVFAGSIITGVSPLQVGRLARNGIVGACGFNPSNPGLQNSLPFPYQAFTFTNSLPTQQCVQVKVEASSCGQQVQSNAYITGFNPNAITNNFLSAMGFSTNNVFTYSFVVPGNSNYVVVNNTVATSGGGASCPTYTMTVQQCEATVNTAIIKELASPAIVFGDANGRALVNYNIYYVNLGIYTAAVPTANVLDTPLVTANPPGEPFTITTAVAGAVVPPGAVMSQSVKLALAGVPNQCRLRSFVVTNTVSAQVGVYHCNVGNPLPTQTTFFGSVIADANFDQDSFVFQARAGDSISFSVDTVLTATAFDIEACISGVADGSCLPGLSGDDEFLCTFLPPLFGCPRVITSTLPADPDGDGLYYLRVNSGSGGDHFAGPVGEYKVLIESVSPGIGLCPFVQVLDGGADSFLTTATTTTDALMAPRVSAAPVQIILRPPVPPCSLLNLPLVKR